MSAIASSLQTVRRRPSPRRYGFLRSLRGISQLWRSSKTWPMRIACSRQNREGQSFGENTCRKVSQGALQWLARSEWVFHRPVAEQQDATGRRAFFVVHLDRRLKAEKPLRPQRPEDCRRFPSASGECFGAATKSGLHTGGGAGTVSGGFRPAPPGNLRGVDGDSNAADSFTAQRAPFRPCAACARVKRWAAARYPFHGMSRP